MMLLPPSKRLDQIGGDPLLARLHGEQRRVMENIGEIADPAARHLVNVLAMSSSSRHDGLRRGISAWKLRSNVRQSSSYGQRSSVAREPAV